MTRRTLLSGMATAIAAAGVGGSGLFSGARRRAAERARRDLARARRFEPERRYDHIGVRVVIVELR